MARPKGALGEREFRDAVRKATREYRDDPSDGKRRRRLDMLARKLVDVAAGGDVPAIKEVADRLDGKPMQGVALDVAVAVTAIERRIIDPVELGQVVTLKVLEKHDDDA